MMGHLTPTSGQALGPIPEHINGDHRHFCCLCCPSSPQPRSPYPSPKPPNQYRLKIHLPTNRLMRVECASLSGQGSILELLSKASSLATNFRPGLEGALEAGTAESCPPPLSPAQAGAVHRSELLTPTQLQSCAHALHDSAPQPEPLPPTQPCLSLSSTREPVSAHPVPKVLMPQNRIQGSLALTPFWCVIWDLTSHPSLSQASHGSWQITAPNQSPEYDSEALTPPQSPEKQR